MGLIYCAIFANGKKYIGQTTQTLAKRKSQHKYYAENFMDDFLFHKAIRKYGFDNIIWEILENNIEDSVILNKREQYWITKMNTYCLNGEGYNMTLGGDNYEHAYNFTLEECYTLFEEYKQCGNASELAAKYNTTSMVILRNIKRVAPEEYKKYTYGGKGSQFIFSDEEAQQVYNYYKITGSLSRTVEEFNSNKRTISRVLKRLDENYFRFSWRYDVKKEEAPFIYEDYKELGNLEELALKYNTTKNTIRNVLIYFDSDYSKYTKRRK